MLNSFGYTEILDLKRKKQYRTLPNLSGIDFSSNDYLSLANSEVIRNKLIQALEKGIPLGSTGSRLISGNTEFHLQAENILSQFLGRKAVLTFSSGYIANEGIISTFGKDSEIFSDEMNHSSIIKGIKLSKSPYYIFRHNNMNHLESLLKTRKSSKQKVIISEALFSMDGDLSPINDLVGLSEKYNSLLIIDEAHSTGVYGTDGKGLLYDVNFDEEKVLSIHTGGKALGAHGCFVGCSEKLKEYLINFCHHFIYSTALPPIQCLHLQYACEEIQKMSQYRDELYEKSLFTRKLFQSTYDIGKSNSHIVPVIKGNNCSVLEISNKLKKRGFGVIPIRFPTVKKGSERIRLSIRAEHTKDDIKNLFDAFLNLSRDTDV